MQEKNFIIQISQQLDLKANGKIRYSWRIQQRKWRQAFGVWCSSTMGFDLNNGWKFELV